MLHATWSLILGHLPLCSPPPAGSLFAKAPLLWLPQTSALNLYLIPEHVPGFQSELSRLCFLWIQMSWPLALRVGRAWPVVGAQRAGAWLMDKA